MKTALHLAWLTIALADIALGYFIVWDWARTPDLALFIMALGALNAAWAVGGLRRPKVKMFNHLKGVSYV